MNTNTKLLLEWHAASRPDIVRSKNWYVAAGCLCAVIIAYGVLTSAWGLSLTFALLPALYYLIRNQNHRRHHIRIFEIGIQWDGRLTPWAEWKEFWILEGPSYHELHIAPQRSSSADLVIQTAEIDPFLVRDVIGTYLPQIGHQKERLLDALIRFCKL